MPNTAPRTGPDARRPAEGEGKAHQERTAPPCGAYRIVAQVHTCLAVEQSDAEHSQKVQSHQHDDDAGDDRQLVLPLAHKQADARRTGPERHEDTGEPQNEQHRIRQRPLPHPRASLRIRIVQHLVDGNACQIGEIRRHERQHTGTEERDQTCKEDAEKGEVRCHAPLLAKAAEHLHSQPRHWSNLAQI